MQKSSEREVATHIGPAGRSQHQALDALYTGLLTEKVNWVLDLDIRGFSMGCPTNGW